MTTAVPTIEADSRRAAPRYHDLHAHPALPVMMVFAVFGLVIDSVLAEGLIASLLSLERGFSILIALSFGLITAAAAVKAGMHLAHREWFATGILIALVLGMGLVLAGARWSVGIDAAATSGDSVRDMALAGSGPDVGEQALAVVMLAMFVVSATALILTSWKLFNPTRHALRRFSTDRKRTAEKLAPLEADLTRVDEWIAFRDEHEKILEGLRDDALCRLPNREAFLKQYARERMVEALGSQSAPIVRAPLEPDANSHPEDPDA